MEKLTTQNAVLLLNDIKSNAKDFKSSSFIHYLHNKLNYKEDADFLYNVIRDEVLNNLKISDKLITDSVKKEN